MAVNPIHKNDDRASNFWKDKVNHNLQEYEEKGRARAALYETIGKVLTVLSYVVLIAFVPISILVVGLSPWVPIGVMLGLGAIMMFANSSLSSRAAAIRKQHEIDYSIKSLIRQRSWTWGEQRYHLSGTFAPVRPHALADLARYDVETMTKDNSRNVHGDLGRIGNLVEARKRKLNPHLWCHAHHKLSEGMAARLPDSLKETFLRSDALGIDPSPALSAEAALRSSTQNGWRAPWDQLIQQSRGIQGRFRHIVMRDLTPVQREAKNIEGYIQACCHRNALLQEGRTEEFPPILLSAIEVIYSKLSVFDQPSMAFFEGDFDVALVVNAIATEVERDLQQDPNNRERWEAIRRRIDPLREMVNQSAGYVQLLQIQPAQTELSLQILERFNSLKTLLENAHCLREILNNPQILRDANLLTTLIQTVLPPNQIPNPDFVNRIANFHPVRALEGLVFFHSEETRKEISRSLYEASATSRSIRKLYARWESFSSRYAFYERLCRTHQEAAVRNANLALPTFVIQPFAQFDIEQLNAEITRVKRQIIVMNEAYLRHPNSLIRDLITELKCVQYSVLQQQINRLSEASALRILERAPTDSRAVSILLQIAKENPAALSLERIENELADIHPRYDADIQQLLRRYEETLGFPTGQIQTLGQLNEILQQPDVLQLDEDKIESLKNQTSQLGKRVTDEKASKFARFWRDMKVHLEPLDRNRPRVIRHLDRLMLHEDRAIFLTRLCQYLVVDMIALPILVVLAAIFTGVGIQIAISTLIILIPLINMILQRSIQKREETINRLRVERDSYFQRLRPIDGTDFKRRVEGLGLEGISRRVSRYVTQATMDRQEKILLNGSLAEVRRLNKPRPRVVGERTPYVELFSNNRAKVLEAARALITDPENVSRFLYPRLLSDVHHRALYELVYPHLLPEQQEQVRFALGTELEERSERIETNVFPVRLEEERDLRKIARTIRREMKKLPPNDRHKPDAFLQKKLVALLYTLKPSPEAMNAFFKKLEPVLTTVTQKVLKEAVIFLIADHLKKEMQHLSLNALAHSPLIPLLKTYEGAQRAEVGTRLLKVFIPVFEASLFNAEEIPALRAMILSQDLVA